MFAPAFWCVHVATRDAGVKRVRPCGFVLPYIAAGGYRIRPYETRIIRDRVGEHSICSRGIRGSARFIGRAMLAPTIFRKVVGADARIRPRVDASIDPYSRLAIIVITAYTA